jgi:hypothetical protein
MPNPTTPWTDAEAANHEAWETQSLGLKTTDETTSPTTDAMTPAAADTSWVRTP